MTDEDKRELSIQRQLSAILERIVRLETLSKVVNLIAGTAVVISFPVLLEYYLTRAEEEQQVPVPLHEVPISPYDREGTRRYYPPPWWELSKGKNVADQGQTESSDGQSD